MGSIIRHVPTLDETQRRSLEALLGHQLLGNQRVYIAVLSELPTTSPVSSQQALQGLRAIGVEVDAHMRQLGVAPEQWNAAVDSACEEVRYGQQTSDIQLLAELRSASSA